MTNPKHNVLYIDDEESNLRVFKYTFRRYFNVYTAISADAGIEILKHNKIDVLITDQRMPEKTGLELLKEIQELFPEIPPHRLMVSGYTEPDDINKAFSDYSLYKFISKPWEVDELKQIIIEVIEKN